ncbi:hypothetical protein BDQ17DRAFT_1347021 [Cyathus striatus]|nr:hypothetical protein BDQ17DRAFT_1347021 [Cyathus striatus]
MDPTSLKSATWEATQRELIAHDVSFLQTLTLFQYVNFASMILLFYDHALTLDVEIERIWTLPWKGPKILFFVNRYFVPLTLISEWAFCTIRTTSTTVCSFKKWAAWPIVISMSVVELILMIRVVAIYLNNKKITKFLLFTFSLEQLIWIGVATYNTIGTRGIPGGNVFQGCVYATPEIVYITWMAPLFFECILFMLTMMRVRKYEEFSGLLKVLTRDSITYFVVAIGCLLFIIFYPLSTNRLYVVLPLLPTSAMSCIGASRMSFNIRECLMTDALTTFECEVQSMAIFRRGRTVALSSEFEPMELDYVSHT